MELTERRKAILSAVIKMYIASGEPVGSKLLVNYMQGAPSSATLRNEMSALCDMGYLEQPHTSAGRVPTSAGYRFYVNSLMKPDEISSETKERIDSMLSFSNCDPEKMPELATEILSQITGLPTISAKISQGGITLRRAELLPMGRNSGMIILITSDGRSRSRLFHIGTPLTSALISRFDNISAQYILRQDISLLTRAKIQGLIAACASDALALLPIFTTLFEMIEDLNRSGVSLKGASNLFSICRQSDAEKIIALMNRGEAVKRLLELSPGPVGVVFGEDTGYSALETAGIIFAKYGAAGKNVGCIGIIGPTRMSYEQIIPSIEYTALRVDKLLGAALADMEE